MEHTSSAPLLLFLGSTCSKFVASISGPPVLRKAQPQLLHGVVPLQKAGLSLPSTLFPPFPSPLDKITDEGQAKEFLAEYNRTGETVWNAYTEASWAYNTNITDHNKEIMVWASPWGSAGRATSQGGQLVPRASFRSALKANQPLLLVKQ